MSKISFEHFSRANSVPKIVQEKPAQAEPAAGGGASFGDLLINKLQEVNQLNLEADQLVQQAVAGEDVNPHTTLIALQKADISFNLLMSVKERIVQAYQEVLRMPIG